MGTSLFAHYLADVVQDNAPHLLRPLLRVTILSVDESTVCVFLATFAAVGAVFSDIAAFCAFFLNAFSTVIFLNAFSTVKSAFEAAVSAVSSFVLKAFSESSSVVSVA